MENRLKERLTGAAILVALIVALVPEMFRGQRSEVATSSSSSADGAPVRSYTIDLSNNPKSSAPLQSTNDAANTVPTAPSATVPPPAAAAAPPGAAAPVASSAPAAVSAPSSAPSAKPAVQPEPTKPEPTKPTAGTAAHAVHATTAPGAWSVQVGIFAKHENAERMAHEVQGRGFAVSISNPDANGLFHVRATGMQDRASAQTLSQKMQAAGIKSAVVPAP